MFLLGFIFQVLPDRWRNTHHCLWNHCCSEHKKLRQPKIFTIVSRISHSAIKNSKLVLMEMLPLNLDISI